MTLGPHMTIETTSFQLVKAIKEAADTFDCMSFVEVVDPMWRRLDVPKALWLEWGNSKICWNMYTLSWLMTQCTSSSCGLGSLAASRSCPGKSNS